MHAFVQRCLHTWRIAREALTRTGEKNKASADRHRTKSPFYVCRQKVWLSSKDINFRLPACKLGPKFIGSFVVANVLSPVTVRLKLTPQFNKIHPTGRVMGRRRDAGFRLATFWTALSLISSISVMVSPGTPGGVPEVGGTVTVQGAFSAPLVVLSFRQLVVWAISADRAAGMHGSRADSLPPVAHFPILLCPYVLLIVYMSHCCPYLFLCYPVLTGLTAQRSSSSCGPQSLSSS